MNQTKKLTLAGLLVALAVTLSGFSIPVGVAKVFPVQHMVNMIAAILLGPVYGVLMAFVTSTIRVSMGTGSLLAYPGSMVGALLAGRLYNKFKTKWAAGLGELVGTGILGALLAYPVAAFFLSKEGAFYMFVIPFVMSSFAGVLMGYLGVSVMEKTGLLAKNQLKEGNHGL